MVLTGTGIYATARLCDTKAIQPPRPLGLTDRRNHRVGDFGRCLASHDPVTRAGQGSLVPDGGIGQRLPDCLGAHNGIRNIFL